MTSQWHAAKELDLKDGSGDYCSPSGCTIAEAVSHYTPTMALVHRVDVILDQRLCIIFDVQSVSEI